MAAKKSNNFIAGLGKRRISVALAVLILAAGLLLAGVSLGTTVVIVYVGVVFGLPVGAGLTFAVALATLLAIPVAGVVWPHTSVADAVTVYAFYALGIGVIRAAVEAGQPEPPAKRQPGPASADLLAPASQSAAPRKTSRLGQWYPWYRFVIFPLLIVGLSVGGLIALSPVVQPLFDRLYPRPSGQTLKNNLAPATTATPTPSPAPSVSPSPKPKASVKISVRNGSGTVGSANRAAAALQQAGYVVGAADIGNADRYDYQQTTFYTADRALATDLAGALGITNFDVQPPRADQGSFDVIVVTGAAS